MIDVSCALILRAGKILITRRSARMPHPLKWEFPGGKIRDGEGTEQGIIREIREELGLEIIVDRLLPPYEYHYSTHAVRLHPCVCRVKGGKPELHEHDACRWIEPGEAGQFDWLEADVAIAKGLGELPGFS